ncbi:MAG: flavodoxin family protein [Candidatus Thorarchaeota archaeon]
MRSLLVLISIHHKNTEKIANVFSRVLDAQIIAPRQFEPRRMHEYDLIGFGSGIYDEKHHRALLELAENLPQVTDRKAFLYSTSGVATGSERFHAPLRNKLQSKGFKIVAEFNCNGFNTNSFLGFFGGMNKGRPNTQDLRKAEEFAQNLLKEIPK